MPPLRGHDSTRKFHCEVQGCSASFVKRAHLRRHEMTHTQRRDFHCPGCNRAFSRNDSMSRHLRRKHPHLYRAHQNTSLDPSDVDHLHLPRLSTVVGLSTTVGNIASSSGTTLSSRPSPFEHHSNSPMQSRQDDHRSFGTQLTRPASTSDMYAHPGLLHTSQGLAAGHSRASAAPQLSESPSSAQVSLKLKCRYGKIIYIDNKCVDDRPILSALTIVPTSPSRANTMLSSWLACPSASLATRKPWIGRIRPDAQPMRKLRCLEVTGPSIQRLKQQPPCPAGADLSRLLIIASHGRDLTKRCPMLSLRAWADGRHLDRVPLPTAALRRILRDVTALECLLLKQSSNRPLCRLAFRP